MGNNANITVAQIARVWLAPVGTVAPTGPVVAMPAAWKEVGYFTPDSLGWTTSPTFEEIRSHQSNYPTRRFQTEDAAAMSVDLQEWNTANFVAVYGGGTVVQVAAQVGPPAVPAYFKFSPPTVGARVQTSACIEIIDGSKHYRRVIPKCEQNEGVEQTFARTAESTLPLRLAVLGADVGDSWYDMTDDPSFVVTP